MVDIKKFWDEQAKPYLLSPYTSVYDALASLSSSATPLDQLIQSAVHPENRDNWQDHGKAVLANIQKGATLNRICQGSILVTAIWTSPRLYGFTTLGMYAFLKNTNQTKTALREFFNKAAKELSNQNDNEPTAEKGYEIALMMGGAMGVFLLAWKVGGGPPTGLTHLLSTTLALGAGMRTGIIIEDA